MSGFIYVIESAGLYKVGYTASPAKRFSKALSDNPAAKMLGVVIGGRNDERALHDQLAPFRVRGEWFADCVDLQLLRNRLSPLHSKGKRPIATARRHAIARYREANGLTLEAFGALVGSNKSAVFKWEDGIGPAPQTAIKIEKATGGEVPRHVLRPDLWPAPAPAPAREGEAA